MRAYQLPKAGAGIESLAIVERPDAEAAASPGSGQGRRLLAQLSRSRHRHAAAIGRRCATISFRCPTAPAKSWKSGPAFPA